MTNYEKIKQYYLNSSCLATVREIASALNLGHGTVYHHLKRVPEYQKEQDSQWDIKSSQHHIREIKAHLKCLERLLTK